MRRSTRTVHSCWFRPELQLLDERITPAVLSDNLDQPASGVGTATGNTFIASSFKSGPAVAQLQTVSLLVQAPNGGGNAVISLYSDGGSIPSNQLIELGQVGIGSVPELAVAGGGIDLIPNTTYWVVLSASSGEVDWITTTSSVGSGSGFQNTFANSDDGGFSWVPTAGSPPLLQVTDNAAGTPPGGAAGSFAFNADSVSVAEGDPPITITITRSGGSTGAITVPVSLGTLSTATAGADFTGLPSSVSFANGQTTATITLTIVNDTLAEGAEFADITLGTPSGNGTLGGVSVTRVNIADNDAPPGGVLAFGEVSYIAQEGTPNVTIDITRSGGTTGAVSVSVNLVSGSTASVNGDYTGIPATVNFANGQAVAQLRIPIIDDAIQEAPETINLILAAPTGGAVLGTQARTTIIIADNDGSNGPAALNFSAATYSINEATSSLTIPVLRTGNTTGTVSVPVTVSGGTATPDGDFRGLPTTITFADGQASALLRLTIVDDSLIEGNETIILQLGAATGNAAPGTLASATVTILDSEQVTGVGVGSGQPLVRVLSSVGAEVRSIVPYDPSVTGGVRVAIADVTADGIEDLITGAGAGGSPDVSLYDGRTGDLLLRFTAFETSFTGGVNVAAGDVDGDGFADIIVTPDVGGGPIVATFSGKSAAGGVFAQLSRFFGIEDPNFRGGARAALGDLNSDGIADLVVAAGEQGGPRIAIFNGTSLQSSTATRVKLLPDFFAFESTLRNGAFVTAADFTGDGIADIAFGGGPGGAPRVRIFDGGALLRSPGFSSLDLIAPTAQVANFFAGNLNSRGGVRLAASDSNSDGRPDLVVGSGEGQPSRQLTYFSTNFLRNPSPIADLEVDPFGGILAGGVYVG